MEVQGRMARLFLLLAAGLGLISVVLGAFAAHGLRDLPTGQIEAFRTGVQYQQFHVLALLGVGILLRREASRLLVWAGACFVFGMLAFSGSLYIMVLAATGSLGLITPLGGLVFMLGWLCLGIWAWRS